METVVARYARSPVNRHVLELENASMNVFNRSAAVFMRCSPWNRRKAHVCKEVYVLIENPFGGFHDNLGLSCRLNYIATEAEPELRFLRSRPTCPGRLPAPAAAPVPPPPPSPAARSAASWRTGCGRAGASSHSTSPPVQFESRGGHSGQSLQMHVWS